MKTISLKDFNDAYRADDGISPEAKCRAFAIENAREFMQQQREAKEVMDRIHTLTFRNSLCYDDHLRIKGIKKEKFPFFDAPGTGERHTRSVFN